MSAERRDNKKRERENPERKEERCGYFGCKPDCLQTCNSTKTLLAATCWLATFQGFVVNGITLVNTSTLERRFYISSTQVAWIATTFDVVAGVFCAVFGIIGGRFHNGKLLTVGATCLTLGSFIMFLPYLLAGEYSLGAASTRLCPNIGGSVCEDGGGLYKYLYMFCAGNALNGVGGAALHSLAIPYMDSNTKIKNTPVYMGFMHGFNVLGPGVGFLLGGYMLSVYVDTLRTREDSVEIKITDPRWVGAWWLGYLISAVCLLPVVFILACFPRRFPSARRARPDVILEVDATPSRNDVISTDTTGNDTTKSSSTVFPDEDAARYDEAKWGTLPSEAKSVLTNKLWWMMTVVAITGGLVVSGISVFLPKFIQYQFGLTAMQGAIYSGIVVITGAAGGQFLGGFVCKYLKLSIRGLLLLTLLCSLIVVVLGPVFLVNCPDQPLVGITHGYTDYPDHAIKLPSQCNEGCDCTTGSYTPVCGVDGMQYFNPCYAGCQAHGLNSVLLNCSCIPEHARNETHDATYGVCEIDCNKLVWFLLVFFVLLVNTFMGNIANKTVTIRCVKEQEKAFAFGIQWSIVRLLGNAAGPLIYGAIFDSSCLVWQEACEERGSCWLYEKDSLAFGLLISVVASALCGVIIFAVCLCWLVKPENPSEPAQEVEDEKTSAMAKGLPSAYVPVDPRDIHGLETFVYENKCTKF